MTTLKSSCFLVIAADGIKRMAKNLPDMKAGEIAVRVTVKADSRHFRMPYAEAVIELGEHHLIHPHVEVEAEPAPTPAAPVADAGERTR